MPTSSVPKPSLTPTGFVLPAEADILAAVQADIDAAFGGGVNPDLRTPQGQIASSTTAVIGDANNTFAELVNQVDPAFATGRMQDSIGHIYFLERNPAIPTAVTATVTGLVGTVIPAGAQAQTTDAVLYVCTTATTIPVGGTTTAPFVAVTAGPVACPAGTLRAIYLAVPGWDTITNLADGVVGANVETATEFEYRRQQSVALNATGSLASVFAAVFDTGVLDAYCTENVTDAPVTIGAVTLAAHSLWACVYGGVAADIAHAIWTKKSIGCNYNGSQSFVVFDTAGYEIPYPQYTVRWQNATPTPILFHLRIANNAYLPANYAALIKAAIVSAFSGGDGGPVARIAAALDASRYYGPVLSVATQGSVIQILSLQLGISAADQDTITMGINQKPTIDPANITITLV